MHTGSLSAGVYAVFLVLFGLLSYLAYRLPSFPGDINISLWLQSTDTSFLTSIMAGVSFIGSLIPAAIIVVLVVIFLAVTKKKLEPLFIASATLISAFIYRLLKFVIARPRPDSEIIRVLVDNNEASFPSGHTVYAVVFYGLLFYLMPRFIRQPAAVGIVRTVLLILIILTGISRVYLGAHWPSDVLGGFLLGGLLLSLTIVLYNKYARKRRIITEDSHARTA